MKRFKIMVSVPLCVVMILTIFCVGWSAEKKEVYPDRTISVVVWSAAGGATDNIARGLMPLVQKDLGVAVPITNITGGAGSVGAQYVMDQKPDGYTYVFGSEAVSTWQVMGMNNYSMPKDLYPVMVSSLLTPALFVPPNSPFKTAKEFFDYALANPGKLRMSVPSVGTGPYLFIMLCKQALGLDVKVVPMTSSTASITAVMGGEVDASFEMINALTQGHQSGLLRVLGTATTKPVSGMEGVPPLAIAIPKLADHLPWGAYFGLYADSRVPRERIDKMAGSLQRVVKSQSWIDYCNKLYIQPLNLTGDEAVKYVKDWTATAAYLLYDAGAAKDNPAKFGIARPAKSALKK
jgi:tripartite-type tricarboxylate transporter receptor subunit TctC